MCAESPVYPRLRTQYGVPANRRSGLQPPPIEFRSAVVADAMMERLCISYRVGICCVRRSPSPSNQRDLCTGCEPLVVGLERQTELVVGHPEVAIPAAGHGRRPQRLHLLGQDADIGRVAALVGEAVEAKAVA